jgi:hypothetical protein
MKKRFLVVGVALALSTLVTSCASYQASALSNPSPELIQNASVNRGVAVVAKTFTREDCNKYFDRDVIAEGYQPVQLYIQNDSKKNYLLSLNRIDLPLARPEEVAKKVHTSTAGRAVGYGVGALIVWPLAIPAIVDGIGSANANDALDSDFSAKAAKDQVIFPYSSVNTVIFVPVEGFRNNFTVTLMDQDTNRSQKFNVISRT